MEKFRACSSITPGNGGTVLFWTDNWSVDLTPNSMQQSFSRFFSFANDPSLSLFEFRSTLEVSTQFHLPLTLQAYNELTNLQHMMALIPDNGDTDNWYWKGK